MNEVLKEALGLFLTAAHRHRFKAPLHVTIRMAHGLVLRVIVVEPIGAAPPLAVKGELTLPLVILATDSNGRVARARITGERMIEPAEFLN